MCEIKLMRTDGFIFNLFIFFFMVTGYIFVRYILKQGKKERIHMGVERGRGGGMMMIA